jgi:hypothetical protein
MTDAYKAEFEEASNWLKLAFHAKQEFPDYPYVNADYEDVKKDCEAVLNEIRRFAGEKSIAYAVITHWLPISRDGCRALADCGIKFLSCSCGPRTEYTGDESVLPYGHAARLLHNRKPDTMLYTRRTKDKRILSSICAYNHVDAEFYDTHRIGHNFSIYDEGTGIRFKAFGGGPTLNLNTPESIKETLARRNGDEFIGVGNHEQYFYPDYFNYQPDMADKFYLLGKTLKDYGYRFITADEFE